MSAATLAAPTSAKAVQLVYAYATKAHEQVSLQTSTDASPVLALKDGLQLSEEKAIILDLAKRQDPSLVGASEADNAEVQKFIDTALSTDAAALATSLEAHLVALTYLVSNHITAADLVAFTKIAEVAASLDKTARTTHVNVLRWFDHIQHLISEATLSAASLARIPIDLTPVPRAAKAEKKKGKGAEAAAPAAAAAAAAAATPVEGGDKAQKKKEKKEKKPKAPPAPAAPVVMVPSQIDLRVGHIIKCEKHPDADSLYVETIDVGEESPRTVVSGLVRYIPLEEMQNRDVILVCNLKPVAMRGVKSFAMVLCASSEDGSVVEIVAPPAGSKPGSRVHVDGFQSGTPEAVLNPKKKIWEAIQPGYKTDADRVAGWVDAEGAVHKFVVDGTSGSCSVPTIVGGGIK